MKKSSKEAETGSNTLKGAVSGNPVSKESGNTYPKCVCVQKEIWLCPLENTERCSLECSRATNLGLMMTP